MDEQNKKSGWIMSIVILLILAIAGYGVFKYTKKDDLANEIAIQPTPTPAIVPPTPTTSTSTPTPSTTPPAATANLYKNGTYTAVGKYNSPGGAEEVGVTVTLVNDVITATTFDAKATRPNSVTYQAKFASGYQVLVIGKKIDEVSLSKVSGSSLTPKGFNDALAQIKVQAKA